MKSKILSLLLLVGAVAFFTGCYSSASGHMKAGNPLSKDKITSRYQRPVGTVVTAARDVLRHNGQIVMDDMANNVIQGKVNQRDVWVKVTQVPEDPKISEVVVQARTRGGGGDVDLASEISKQIAVQMVGR